MASVSPLRSLMHDNALIFGPQHFTEAAYPFTTACGILFERGKMLKLLRVGRSVTKTLYDGSSDSGESSCCLLRFSRLPYSSSSPPLSPDSPLPSLSLFLKICSFFA